MLLIAEVNEVFWFTQYFRPYNWFEDKRDQCTFIVHHCQQVPWKGQAYLYRCSASTPNFTCTTLVNIIPLKIVLSFIVFVLQGWHASEVDAHTVSNLLAVRYIINTQTLVVFNFPFAQSTNCTAYASYPLCDWHVTAFSCLSDAFILMVEISSHSTPLVFVFFPYLPLP